LQDKQGFWVGNQSVNGSNQVQDNAKMVAEDMRSTQGDKGSFTVCHQPHCLMEDAKIECHHAEAVIQGKGQMAERDTVDNHSGNKQGIADCVLPQ
jgi:hypothetical protein